MALSRASSGSVSGASDSGSMQAREVKMITCTPQSTLLEVMGVLSDNRIHRVYIVAAQGATIVQPISVITPTDILRLLAGTPRQ